MSSREAVGAAAPPADDAWREGKQALAGAHRGRVDCADPRRLTGSLDLDSALAREPRHADAPRRDYGIGYRPRRGDERAVRVEVHPASTSNVAEVLAKLGWLRRWLSDEAPDLEAMTGTAGAPKPFVRVAVDGVRIQRGSPQARRLSAAGLDMPRQRLSLP